VQSQARAQRFRGKLLELGDVDCDLSLKIPYSDLRDCTTGSHLTI
jgi:hypothetical protein